MRKSLFLRLVALIMAVFLCASPVMAENLEADDALAMFDESRLIEDVIDSYIASLADVPEGVVPELRIAISALAQNNPIYTPHETVLSLSKGMLGFFDYPDEAAVTAIYSYDGKIGISPKSLHEILRKRSKNLRYLFVHELSHALNVSGKSENGKGFLYKERDQWGNCTDIKVFSTRWGARIQEGLTDIYAFSALGHKLKKFSSKYAAYYAIESPYMGPQEQAVAWMFLNAFGRKNVDSGYFGTQEQNNAFEAYCAEVAGISFGQIMSLTTETVAWLYAQSYAPKTSAGDVNSHVVVYLDLVLKVCEARVTDTTYPLTLEEIDALMSYSIVIRDKAYMKNYKAKLKELKAAIAK